MTDYNNNCDKDTNFKNISKKTIENYDLINEKYDLGNYPITTDRNPTSKLTNDDEVGDTVDLMTFSQFGNFINNKKTELSKFKNTLIRSSEQHIFNNNQNIEKIESNKSNNIDKKQNLEQDKSVNNQNISLKKE